MALEATRADIEMQNDVINIRPNFVCVSRTVLCVRV